MCARALPDSVALSDHACALVSLGRLLRALLEAEAALWPVTIMGNMKATNMISNRHISTGRPATHIK